MHQHDEHHQHDLPSFRQQVNCMIGLAQIVAAPLELLFRKWGSAGELYHNGRSAIGVVLMVITITLVGATPLDSQVALWAGGIALFLFAAHRSRQQFWARQGFECHSLYSGKSFFDRGKDLNSELRAKGYTEPSVALFAGILCLGFSQGLGAWMIAAAIALAISASISKHEAEATQRGIRDAIYEQRLAMRALRNGDVE